LLFHFVSSSSNVGVLSLHVQKIILDSPGRGFSCDLRSSPYISNPITARPKQKNAPVRNSNRGGVFSRYLRSAYIKGTTPSRLDPSSVTLCSRGLGRLKQRQGLDFNNIINPRSGTCRGIPGSPLFWPPTAAIFPFFVLFRFFPVGSLSTLFTNPC
jgi:hypothetical protein